MNVEQKINRAFNALNAYDEQRQQGREGEWALAVALNEAGIGVEEQASLLDLVKTNGLWGIYSSFYRLVKIRTILEK